MKRLILILCTIACFSTHAQTVYLADTAFFTNIGAGGAPASCKTNGCTYNSVGMDRSQYLWVADAFTVPAGATWIFDTVIVYGYQYGSGLASPLRSCNLQIYNGAPGLGGVPIWGDTVTNVMVSSTFTGIYKVDTFVADSGLLSTRRPIMDMKLHLSPAPRLTAGTYWMAWSAAGLSTFSGPASPYKVLPGRVNPTGQMARIGQLGTWIYITDNGNSIGLDKIIKGKAGLENTPILNGAEGARSIAAPNPFSSSTHITFNLTQACFVQLTVYNSIGQLVATLANGDMDAGAHRCTFNAERLPAGSYYYRLSTPWGTESRQMVLMR